VGQTSSQGGSGEFEHSPGKVNPRLEAQEALRPIRGSRHMTDVTDAIAACDHRIIRTFTEPSLRASAISPMVCTSPLAMLKGPPTE